VPVKGLDTPQQLVVVAAVDQHLPVQVGVSSAALEHVVW
jgi:hypothetical protein